MEALPGKTDPVATAASAGNLCSVGLVTYCSLRTSRYARRPSLHADLDLPDGEPEEGDQGRCHGRRASTAVERGRARDAHFNVQLAGGAEGARGRPPGSGGSAARRCRVSTGRSILCRMACGIAAGRLSTRQSAAPWRASSTPASSTAPSPASRAGSGPRGVNVGLLAALSRSTQGADSSEYTESEVPRSRNPRVRWCRKCW
jgi:hypothetical protein